MKVFAIACIFALAQACPVHEYPQCGEHEQTCSGGFDSNGCANPSYCYPKESHCPVYCAEDETECSSQYDYATGTYTAPTCMKTKYGDCDNHCNVYCAEGQTLCKGAYDSYSGCPMADFCYHEAFCPVECDYATEKKCSGEYDSNAGKKISADTCISMKNGECENHCPVFCSEGQTLCPGGTDSMGCAKPDFCHHGEFCPVECKADEKMCSGQYDYAADKQVSQDTCQPYYNGECESQCNVYCREGEAHCPGGTDSNGCPKADFCYHEAFCPVECDTATQKHCEGQYDSNAGKKTSADTCIPRMNGNCENHCPVYCDANQGQIYCEGSTDSNGCQYQGSCHTGAFCPVTCNSDQTHCSGSWDYSSSPSKQITADTCIDRYTGDCYNYCPVFCGPNEKTCSGGVDSNGCAANQDSCYPIDSDCPAV